MSSQKWRCSCCWSAFPSQWSAILLPIKVWLLLDVWWQRKREVAFSRKICRMMKKHTFPSLISLHVWGNMHIQDGTILQDTLCMRHVLYIDWLVYIFTISTTSLASRKSVWDYLFQWNAQFMSCVASIMDNPLEVPEVLREGPTGLIFALIIYKGCMKTLSSRCVLVLIVLFIWLRN